MTADVDASLVLIDGLHARWVALLDIMNTEDYLRTFYHPENQRKRAWNTRRACTPGTVNIILHISQLQENA